MRVKPTPEEAREAARLAVRSRKCAQLCQEVGDIDPVESLLSRETKTLCDILGMIQSRVDSGECRLAVCLKLIEVLCNIQEENVAERKAQLARHSRQ